MLINLFTVYTQPILTQIVGVKEGDRFIRNKHKKDLHTEEVSEGGGCALPEVLPAQVVLLRSLHCTTLKLKHIIKELSSHIQPQVAQIGEQIFLQQH